jgi:hypothetical protein
MEVLSLVGVAGLERLGGREVAALAGRSTPESVASRVIPEHRESLAEILLLVSFSFTWLGTQN